MFFKTLLLLANAAMLCSCYSFTATTLPSHIKTVNIADVDCRSFDPVLGNRLKDGLRELFRTNAPAVRIINDEADSDLTVTIMSYSNRPMNQTSNAEVETYVVTMGISVLYNDNVRKKAIFEHKSIMATGVYDVLKNESEEIHGQERAIKMLQGIIVNGALAKW
jgi:hypothetical protein